MSGCVLTTQTYWGGTPWDVQKTRYPVSQLSEDADASTSSSKCCLHSWWMNEKGHPKTSCSPFLPKSHPGWENWHRTQVPLGSLDNDNVYYPIAEISGDGQMFLPFERNKTRFFYYCSCALKYSTIGHNSRPSSILYTVISPWHRPTRDLLPTGLCSNSPKSDGTWAKISIYHCPWWRKKNVEEYIPHLPNTSPESKNTLRQYGVTRHVEVGFPHLFYPSRWHVPIVLTWDVSWCLWDSIFDDRCNKSYNIFPHLSVEVDSLFLHCIHINKNQFQKPNKLPKTLLSPKRGSKCGLDNDLGHTPAASAFGPPSPWTGRSSPYTGWSSAGRGAGSPHTRCLRSPGHETPATNSHQRYIGSKQGAYTLTWGCNNIHSQQ